MAACLHPSCENLVGQTIYVRPVHGWGWSRLDKRFPESSIEAPRPFLPRVAYLTHQGLLNGFMGRVEESEHDFNGLWGVTYLRYAGEWDLVSSVPMNDILLGPNEPYLKTLEDDPELERWYREKGREPWHPLWGLSGSPQFGGQTYLAASREIAVKHIGKESGYSDESAL